MLKRDVTQKKLLIVGNGGSSINGHAKGLSKDKDVFRVNKFFLEPSLLFGRNIKFAVFPGEPFFIFFIDYLIRNNIYKIDVVCYKKLHRRFFLPKVKSLMITWESFIENYKCKNSVPGFFDANQIDSVEQYGKITTGPYLINCAIQMGYKHISIIGIDFYSEKSGKKYPISIPRIWRKISIFEAPFSSERINKIKGSSYDQGHCVGVDITYIKALVNKYKDVAFNVYVDEDNPYVTWKNIVESGDNNVTVHKMKDCHADSRPAHCLSDIEKAIIEYQHDYFWKDKVMNAGNLFTERKAVIRNSLLRIKESLIKTTWFK